MKRLLLLLAAGALAGCPEERAGTRRQVPAARVPPAVPVEAQPAPAPAPAERSPATSAR